MSKFHLMDFSLFIRIVDPVLRPQSEFKVTTPGDKPPLPSFSAPPNAAEQEKMNGKFQQQINPLSSFSLLINSFLFFAQPGRMKLLLNQQSHRRIMRWKNLLTQSRLKFATTNRYPVPLCVVSMIPISIPKSIHRLWLVQMLPTIAIGTQPQKKMFKLL